MNTPHTTTYANQTTLAPMGPLTVSSVNSKPTRHRKLTLAIREVAGRTLAGDSEIQINGTSGTIYDQAKGFTVGKMNSADEWHRAVTVLIDELYEQDQTRTADTKPASTPALTWTSVDTTTPQVPTPTRLDLLTWHRTSMNAIPFEVVSVAGPMMVKALMVAWTAAGYDMAELSDLIPPALMADAATR